MKKPTVHPDAFVAFNATVRGDVRIEEGASIFYGAVLRGDGPLGVRRRRSNDGVLLQLR